MLTYTLSDMNSMPGFLYHETLSRIYAAIQGAADTPAWVIPLVQISSFLHGCIAYKGMDDKHGLGVRGNWTGPLA